MSPTMTAAPQIAKPVKESRAKLLKHVKDEIKALRGEIATLEDTCKALEGRSAPTTRTRGGNGSRTTSRKPTRTRAGARAPTARRTRRGPTLGADTLTTFMAPGKAYTSKNLSTMCGMSPNTTLRRLKALEQAGAVKRHGAGPETRWTLT